MSQSSVMAEGELTGPEGTQEGNSACLLAARRQEPLPTASPEKTQEVKTQDTDPRQLWCISKE